MELRRGAFFDRDGVINASPAPGDYIRRWEEFRLIPEAAEWIRVFNALDMPVIVVTNQRGVDLGLIDPAELERIHTRMCATLAAQGARIDDVFCCPHAEAACNCRKPRPGLVTQAAKKWNIDLRRSVLLGDSWRDRELALICGIRFAEVCEGHLIGSLPEEANAYAAKHVLGTLR